MVDVDPMPFLWPFTARRMNYVRPTPPPPTPPPPHPHPTPVPTPSPTPTPTHLHLDPHHHSCSCPTPAPAPACYTYPWPILRQSSALTLDPTPIAGARPRRVEQIFFELMPFAKATLLEGHQYGVEKLWSRAFQRRIDDHLEVLRFKPIRDRRFQTCPYGQEYRLGVNAYTS